MKQNTEARTHCSETLAARNTPQPEEPIPFARWVWLVPKFWSPSDSSLELKHQMTLPKT
jgi:hypothetical protein